MPTNGVFLKRLKSLGADQSGAIAAYAAIGMVVFLGLGALTLDIGHLVAAKSELQKAADAGALAGARALNLVAPAPNWTNGSTVADATVKKNKMDGSLLTKCTVQTGYWDLTWNQGTAPADLKSTGIVPGATDVAAVKVTVEKSSGNNSGPLTMLFGKVFGKGTEILKVQAVAAMIPDLPVVTIPSGEAFPLATPISWVNLMWKPDANSDTFRIGSSYHDPTGGQWTSFLIDANNVPTIRQLINSGNPGPLTIGDQIWIEPGTKTTIYSDAAAKKGSTVLLPIVADDFNTHDDTPILAFVPFYIEDAVGGSDKYIQGHFVPHFTAEGATGSANAPNYGAIGYNAKLVN
jgi:Flp pilus assembly protein TadG